MRVVWLLFGVLLAGLGGAWWYTRPADPAPTASRPATSAPAALPVQLVGQRTAAPVQPPGQAVPVAAPAAASRADSLVRFALAQLGTNYCYAGTTPATGFDCSGFVQYVFGHFRVAVPHATALLITAGRAVPRAQARPGDIVVFTGTDSASTSPGHAGIVVSATGQRPLRFVHSSSARREPGVKVSAVEGSGYERRFLGVRRVL